MLWIRKDFFFIWIRVWREFRIRILHEFLIYQTPPRKSCAANFYFITKITTIYVVFYSVADPGCRIQGQKDSRILISIFYPSRIPGSKRHRIPDPDPQHWFLEYKLRIGFCNLIKIFWELKKIIIVQVIEKLWTLWKKVFFFKFISFRIRSASIRNDPPPPPEKAKNLSTGYLLYVLICASVLCINYI